MSKHKLKKEIGYKWKRAQLKCILDSKWKKETDYPGSSGVI